MIKKQLNARMSALVLKAVRSAAVTSDMSLGAFVELVLKNNPLVGKELRRLVREEQKNNG